MTTYYARVDYSYSGDSKFTIPFSYIKKEHIVVFVNKTKITNYIYITSSQIEVKDELLQGDIVSIRRTTPINNKIVNFNNLNVLNGETQNLAQEQVLNAVQEMYDKNQQQTQDIEDKINDYTSDIEDKINEVKQATDIINTFQESVETCVNKAEIATEAATTATEKANAMTASVNQIEANKNNLLQELVDRANADASVTSAFKLADEALRTYVHGLFMRSTGVFSPSLNFLKAGSTHNSLKFRKDTRIEFKLGETNHVYFTDVEFDVTEKLDEGTIQPAKDYCVYIYKTEEGFDFKVSLNATYPTGMTANQVYKIGGFHTLCVGVTEANAPVIPTDSWFTVHTAIGYNAGDIIPNSVWCLTHRPVSQPNGMVYVDLIRKWVDIYLQSGTLKNTVSVYQGTTTDTRQPILHQLDMLLVGKELPTDSDFFVFAEGSNNLTAIKGAADAVTTGGHLDTANKRMISCYFIEDCCGFLWQWLNQLGFNGQTNWASYGTNATFRGQSYGMPFVLLAGGVWYDSSSCGSWSRDCADGRATVYTGGGCRGVSRSLYEGIVD